MSDNLQQKESSELADRDLDGVVGGSVAVVVPVVKAVLGTLLNVVDAVSQPLSSDTPIMRGLHPQ